jgi:hypothetical protein
VQAGNEQWKCKKTSHRGAEGGALGGYSAFIDKVREFDKALAKEFATANSFVPTARLDTRAKNEAKTAAKAVIRPFVNRFLREDWAVVTDMDRDAIGVPTRDKIPTHHPVPSTKPELDAVPSGQGKHTVTAINPQTKRKPALVKGVAFAHKVRDAADPKARADDMPSVFQTSAVKNFQWLEADYGKVADYAVAYENEGGKRGPWSDVASVIIA